MTQPNPNNCKHQYTYYHPSGFKVIKCERDLPKRYPSWIKVNNFATDYPPYETLNIPIDEKIIQYFKTHSKLIPDIVYFKGYRPVSYFDLLRFNRFFTLTNEDVTNLGRFAMREFLEYYGAKHFQEIHYFLANKFACVMEGIITDYAILHDAGEDLIHSIKELAKGMKYTYDFTFRDQWIPYNHYCVLPCIHYKTGKYTDISNYSLEDLGLEELHVVKCRWPGRVDQNNSQCYLL